jgi:hypothetical protein
MRLTLDPLKDIAHCQGLTGVSKLDKAGLVNAIRTGVSPTRKPYERPGAVSKYHDYKPYRPPKARNAFLHEFDERTGVLDMIKEAKSGRKKGGLVHTHRYEDADLDIDQTVITRIGKRGMQQAATPEGSYVRMMKKSTT